MANLQKCCILITLHYARKKSFFECSSNCGVFLPVREVQANVLSNVLNFVRRESHTAITEDTEEGTVWHKNKGRWQRFGQELPWKKIMQSNGHRSLVFLVEYFRTSSQI